MYECMYADAERCLPALTELVWDSSGPSVYGM